MNKVKDLFDLIKPEIFNSVKMIEKSKLFGENWAQKHTKINIEKAKKNDDGYSKKFQKVLILSSYIAGNDDDGVLDIMEVDMYGITRKMFVYQKARIYARENVNVILKREKQKGENYKKGYKVGEFVDVYKFSISPEAKIYIEQNRLKVLDEGKEIYIKVYFDKARYVEELNQNNNWLKEER